MNFLRKGFQKLSSDKQTERHDRNYIPCHFTGGQLLLVIAHGWAHCLPGIFMRPANILAQLLQFVQSDYLLTYKHRQSNSRAT